MTRTIWEPLVGVLTASTLLAGSAFAAPAPLGSHAHPRADRAASPPGLAGSVGVTPAPGSTNIRPDVVISWTGRVPPGPRGPAAIIVSTAAGSVIYRHPALVRSGDTWTWTPPGALTRYTTTSVAWVSRLLPPMMASRSSRSLAGLLSRPPEIPGPHDRGPIPVLHEIAAVHGSTVTFLDGTLVSLSDPVIGLRPGAALHPGQFLAAMPRGRWRLQPTPGVEATVFTTGSALGEPVQWRAAWQSPTPSVLTGDRLTVTATDSYGDPATMGSAVLAPTSDVSPTWIASEGRLVAGVATLVAADHAAQSVTAQLVTTRPYARDDQTLVLPALQFQPGPPAQVQMAAPSPITVGQSVTVTGTVHDRYGNPVADGTAVTLTAPGFTGSAATTSGAFALAVPVPTTSGSWTLEARAGSVAATPVRIQLAPGAPARVTVTTPASVSPGTSFTVTGTVTDRYGNPVANGTPVTATDGASTAQGVTTGGAYQVALTAPSTAGSVSVSATAGSATSADPGATAQLTVATPYGSAPGVGPYLTRFGTWNYTGNPGALWDVTTQGALTEVSTPGSSASVNDPTDAAATVNTWTLAFTTNGSGQAPGLEVDNPASQGFIFSFMGPQFWVTTTDGAWPTVTQTGSAALAPYTAYQVVVNEAGSATTSPWTATLETASGTPLVTATGAIDQSFGYTGPWTPWLWAAPGVTVTNFTQQ